MNPTRACPKCGAPLPADAPAGHCPQCLLALAVQAAPGEATRAALEQATLDSGSARHGVPPLGGSGGGPAKAGTPNPAPALQFKPGDQVRYFGDYELLEEIARGGMGVVFKAKQQSLNRVVAVKMILGGQLATEADVRRFRTEAEAAANLQHPNIVAIHEIGEHEGRHYFSMDFVEGKNLAQILGTEPLPSLQAATLLKTIAEAVHYAHQRGTLHRDLKPHNVLIDPHGQPRITDFGLAKLIQQDSGVTQEGSVMGSPSYMPPEQATGRQADVGPASDVYSLGAILYQMLTGKVPFSGATAVDTLRAVVEQEPVAPAKLNDRVPADLETICLKCLEKKPERRYASARALAEELARFLNHEPILARPASAARRLVSWCRRHPWVITAAAAVLLLGLAGLAFGLWQQTRFLDWRHAHPNASLVDNRFKQMWVVVWLVTLCLFFPTVHYLELFLNHRHQSQARLNRNTRTALWLGLLATLLSVGFGLEMIRQLVWARWSWYDALAGVSIVFVLCWNGLMLIWTSVRQDETLALAPGGAGSRPAACRLEMNHAAFLFAFPIANWLAAPAGRMLVEWAQFQSPQGFLANGTYVLAPAMTASYRAGLVSVFTLVACSLAMVLPLGIAAWRSPKGDSFRGIAPLAIGFVISFVSLMFSFIPPALTAASLLLGFVLGLGLLAAMRMRVVPVIEEAGKDWKLQVNERATLQLLPWVALGLAASAAFLTQDGWLQSIQTFAFGVLFASLGVLASGWRRHLARQHGLFAGAMFFAFFLATNGAIGLPDFLAIKAAALRLGPATIAGYLLYRAASQPIASLDTSKPQP